MYLILSIFNSSIMKFTFIVPLLALGVFFIGGALAPADAHAYSNSGYSYGYGQQYQQAYRFQDRVWYLNDERDIRAFIAVLIDHLRDLQDQLDDDDFDDDRNRDGRGEVEIATRGTSNITDDEARVFAEILDFNGSDFADVWFEYGRDDDELLLRTSIERIDEDDDEDFFRTLHNLREDTRYFYRAVARDEDGDEDFGSIRSFTTDDEDFDDDDEPRATTFSARSVTDDSADLRGNVDMNDFNNGHVFFVYGEDEDEVDDVEDEDTFDEIDERGEDLQKVSVDRDLDGEDDFTEEVDNLDEDTRHYFRICVEYEDDDDDETLECGGIGSFTTDDD